MSLNLFCIAFLAQLCVLCLAGVAAAAPAAAPSCGEESLGYEFAVATGRCYKFHAAARSWSAARGACSAEGARLAVSGSAAEEAIRDADHTYLAAVGLYWDPVPALWMTVDGPSTLQQAGGHAEWARRPRNMDVYPYVFMHRGGRLYLGSGDSARPFLCEKPPSS